MRRGLRALLGHRRRRRQLAGLGASVCLLALVTGTVFLFRPSVPVLSLGVLYLFAVLPVAVVWGHAHAVPVAVASMLVFNFFFLEPRHTFHVADRTNWFALAVYLATALVVSDLASRARRRAAQAEQRERESALLAQLSRALLEGRPIESQRELVAREAARILDVPTAELKFGPPQPRAGLVGLALDAGEQQPGTLYIPDVAEPNAAARERFLPALASLLALALDHEQLEREALAAERLRLSDSVKTAILRAVSHDLRSPLTAIRVAAESLASPSVSLSDADRAQQLETVRQESRRLDRLVANLLDLSRLEGRAAVPQRELVAVDELVGQALAQVDGNGRIRVDMGEEAPLVEVDPVQIERVLVNLLENALRFAPAGDQVLVQVDAHEQEAVIRIIDHGPGIPPRDLERIFEPFEHVADGDPRQGTGLGLAIARGFAEANGGRIWAEANGRRGTSFAVAFPPAFADATQ